MLVSYVLCTYAAQVILLITSRRSLLDSLDSLVNLLAGGRRVGGVHAQLFEDVVAAGATGDGLANLIAGALGVGGAEADVLEDLLTSGEEL